MKRTGYAALLMILVIGLLTGCGKEADADTNTVSVAKNGKITSYDFEEFDKSYYDEDELKKFIDGAVEDYNAGHEKGAVKADEVSVTDNVAKLKMTYKTAADYEEFNGTELYTGRVVQAMADGYDFDVDFAGIDGDNVYGVTKSDITSQEDLKVVIIKANTNVRVDGKICYVSCKNVTVTGKNTISVKEGTGIEQTWKSEAVPSTEDVTEDTEEFVVEGEVIMGTEEPESVTNLSGDLENTDVYTYIIYK